MSFIDLLKKYVIELNDYWHSRMSPTLNWIRVDDFKMRNPVYIITTSLLGELDEIKEFVKKYADRTDDYKAFITHFYILHKWQIKYKGDVSVWNKVEYWQTPEQTLVRGTGDCEDFTLLWMKLMQLLGVPSYKCMAIGCIMSSNIGHLFPVYFNNFKVVNFDLTYYAKVMQVRNRAIFKIPNSKYKKLLYAFNWRSSYKKPYWL